MTPASQRASTAVPADAPVRPRKRPKELWIKLHLYLGLGLGSLFALLSLAGSLTVYADELDRWVNPALFASEGTGSASLAPGALIAAATQRAPNGSELRYIEVRSASPSTMMVAFEPAGSHIEELHLERSTGRILGSRPEGQSLGDLILLFHDSFFLDELGADLVGVLGILLLLSISSGVYIWWPGRRRAFQALKVHRSGNQRRFHYELHRTAGALAAGLLMVACVTGIYQAFPDPFFAAIGADDETWPAPEREADAPLDLAAGIRMAEAEFPGAILRRADLIVDGSTQIRVIMHDPRQPGWRGGESRLWIDAASGAVVRRRAPDRQPIGSKVLAWFSPLHTGEIGGETGRFIMFVVGLVPAVLLFTGFRLWQIRRKARRRSSAAPPI
jgi:uncharacterized iron-regulated membrane protein